MAILLLLDFRPTFATRLSLLLFLPNLPDLCCFSFSSFADFASRFLLEIIVFEPL